MTVVALTTCVVDVVVVLVAVVVGVVVVLVAVVVAVVVVLEAVVVVAIKVLVSAMSSINMRDSLSLAIQTISVGSHVIFILDFMVFRIQNLSKNSKIGFFLWSK